MSSKSVFKRRIDLNVIHIVLTVFMLYYNLDINAQKKIISFENNGLPADTFWYCKNECNSFNEGPFEFESKYDTAWGGFWSGGFAMSSMRDDTTEGYTNLYSAIPAKANDGTTYLIGQNNSRISCNKDEYNVIIRKISITNSTYAYWSMRKGDFFAKKFGGVSGNDPDYFKIRIYGYPTKFTTKITDAINLEEYADVYLADFRDSINANDFILDHWLELNIDSLFTHSVESLRFELFSSDTSQFGINTPAFFALDKIEYDDSGVSTKENDEIQVRIFPSITSGHFEIDSEEHILKKILIFNLQGNLCFVSCENPQHYIYAGHLKPGVYYVKIITENGNSIQKLLKY